MTADRQDPLAALSQLRRQCEAAEEALLADHGEKIEAYRHEVSAGVGEALQDFRRTVDELSLANELCLDLADQTCDYVEWLQWTFWDLPYFAVAMRPEPRPFRHAVASCGLVYLSARLLDDLMDRHLYYRGRRPSLLATFSESHGEGRKSEHLTMLAALLLCFQGLRRLADRLGQDSQQPARDETAAQMLRQVLTASSAAVVGAIMEHSPAETWSKEYYERLIELKNVAYWRCLYAAIDPDFASPLYPFLVDHYTVAQKLNDIQDYAEDEDRGQPNLISILRSRAEGSSASPAAAAPRRATTLAIERVLLADFLRLGSSAEELPPVERQIARLKLGEYLQEASRLGLFEPPRDGTPAAEEPTRKPLDLHFDSTLEEFLDRLGPEALEEVDCPVCGDGESRLLLRQRGFCLQRCVGCTHVFVSPRLSPEIPARLAEELDAVDEIAFPSDQSVIIGYLCQRLRNRGAGQRLLDIGFGNGRLLETARAYGFEAYGIESSRARCQALEPLLGERVQRAWLGDSELPWGSFDVVVMSHVVEHLPDPATALRRVRDAMNDEGLVYVAVPDIESLQFRVLGRRWVAINAVAHFQYFNEESLTRLLDDAGFEILTRLQPAASRQPRTARWATLLRRLGDTDAGELAVLARARER
jgi:2-polyprenyl-3-methyl-5-hydroxy-6-metoxy-1,4-benzoquinol methylase